MLAEHAIEKAARARAERRLEAVEEQLQAKEVWAVEFAKSQQESAARQVEDGIARGTEKLKEEVRGEALDHLAEAEESYREGLAAEREMRVRIEAKSRELSTTLSATVAQLKNASEVLTTSREAREASEARVRELEDEVAQTRRAAQAEQKARRAADAASAALDSDGVGSERATDIPNPLLMDDDDLYTEFVAARKYAADPTQNDGVDAGDGAGGHRQQQQTVGKRTIMVQTEVLMSRAEEGWKDEAEYCRDQLAESERKCSLLEERLRLAEMTRKDALDTAEERERSRLAVLRELEDAGPAKCVELMGEVESLRLGLAHKHHELEEEQQRAQMYAEDVVEAQAKAAEEEARADTAEEKLEAAALVEEENEILREALHSMDDGARQAQRGLNRIHDEAIGAEQAMQDKLIAVETEAAEARAEGQTLRTALAAVQAQLEAGEEGLAKARQEAQAAVAAVAAEGEGQCRAIEAAANARVQEEIARWSEAERTALGYKEQLVQAEGRLVTLESELATATAGLAEKVRTAANFASPDFCLSRGSACGVCVVCTVPFWAGLEHRSRAQHCALLSPFVFG